MNWRYYKYSGLTPLQDCIRRGETMMGAHVQKLLKVSALIVLGANSPAEIAVSVLAEILQVMRKTSGRPLSQG